MNRRVLITLLGGAAAWPVAARAQQRTMPVIGALFVGWREANAFTLIGLHQGLRETGYVEGQNVRFEYRFAEGRRERLPDLAADLVRRGVSVIVAGAGTADVAKTATTTIPIVFNSGGDPVRLGLVASLNRPGGNLTGVTVIQPDLVGKRLGLLRELLPNSNRIAALMDTGAPSYDLSQRETEIAGRSLGLQLRVITVGSERELDEAFVTFSREGAEALLVNPSVLLANLRDRLVSLAARHQVPAIYELREFADAGGLLSYGPSVRDAYRQIGTYIGRILKGEKPGELPVVQPTKFDLIINLKTAKALGLTIPDKLLALADKVIE